MSAPAEVSVSSPGKVLIIGGYLVLQEGTPGLVVSTTARFHATISTHPVYAAPTAHVDFLVASPQFHKDWRFRLEAHRATASLRIVSAEATEGNVFVEHAVNTALVATVGVLGFEAAAARFGVGRDASVIRLLLQADNDFYSQRAHLVARGLPVSSASLASLPPFLPCPLDAATGKPQVSKTGLGSSAALTTSVASAILLFAGAAQLDGSSGTSATPSDALSVPASRALIHTVAQVAHGLAQGKVGSGFDVCSAAYGSIEYTRVPPSSLGEAMSRTEEALSAVAAAATGPSAATGDAPDARDKFAAAGRLLKGLAQREVTLLQATVHSREAVAPAAPPAGPTAEETDPLLARWSVGVRPFGLPQGLRLLLADVAGGSETPSMVRQVLAWREGKTAPAACADSEPLVRSLASLDRDCSAEDILACFSAGMGAASDGYGLSGGLPTPDAAQEAAMLAAASSSTGPALWKASAAANARAAVVVEQLHALVRTQPSPYAEAIQIASVTSWHNTPCAAAAGQATAVGQVLCKLMELVQAFAHCRRILRAIGVAAGVPIEPMEQQSLADATCALPGVLAAGVPGAGGFDALFCILAEPAGCGTTGDCTSGRGTQSMDASSEGIVRAAVESLWLRWPGGGLTPLLLTNGPAFGEAGAGVLLGREAGLSAR